MIKGAKGILHKTKRFICAKKIKYATSKAFYPVETLIKMCKEIDHVKCIKMGTRVTSIYEHDVRELRKECPDISLITCHDETLCVS